MATQRKRARLERQEVDVDVDVQGPENERTRRIVDSQLLLLPVVVGILAQNGHIGATELGRIGTTCSTLRDATRDDDASWASLCRRRWGNTDEVPRSVIDARGYRWLHKRRTGGIPNAAESAETTTSTGENDDDASDDDVALPPPPARVTHENLMLLVDISVEGVSYMSEAFTGNALRPLLEKGSMPLALDCPVPLGWLNDDETIEMSGKVHIMAHVLDLTANKCACLIDARTMSHRPGGAYSPSYIFVNEGGGKKTLSPSLPDAVLASDTFLCRTDGRSVGFPGDLTKGSLPLKATTASLANRAIPSIGNRDTGGGIKGIMFQVQACQVMAKSFEKHLAFPHLFSKLKERKVFDDHQSIQPNFLMGFEEGCWHSYFNDDDHDPMLADFVEEADALKKRFGSDTVLVSKFELQACKLDKLWGAPMTCPFYLPPNAPSVSSFGGVTLHHIIDGLREWDMS